MFLLLNSSSRWFGLPAFISCFVTLGKLFNLSVSWFPHVLSGNDKRIYFSPQGFLFFFFFSFSARRHVCMPQREKEIGRENKHSLVGPGHTAVLFFFFFFLSVVHFIGILDTCTCIGHTCHALELWLVMCPSTYLLDS